MKDRSETTRSTGPAASTDAFSLHGFITHLVPTSIFDAMARNEILQIVVFSVFVGTAVAASGGGVLVVIGVVICAIAFPAFLRYTVRSAVERSTKG